MQSFGCAAAYLGQDGRDVLRGSMTVFQTGASAISASRVRHLGLTRSHRRGAPDKYHSVGQVFRNATAGDRAPILSSVPCCALALLVTSGALVRSKPHWIATPSCPICSRSATHVCALWVSSANDCFFNLSVTYNHGSDN